MLVCFFSDIEHEVLLVTESYQVTLTYNLYYGTGHLVKLTSVFRTLQVVLSNPLFIV